MADPLEGVTLEAIVTALSTHYGWDELGQRIPIPWARDKAESLYLFMLREIKRASPTVHNFPPPRDPATRA